MNTEWSKFSWPSNEDKLNTQEPSIIASGLSLKTTALVSYITENPKAADLKWSLFCAACNSYRFDSVLKPFPPSYLVDNDTKQIDRLRQVIAECTPLPVMVENLKLNKVSVSLLNLLYWVLVHLNEPVFKLIPKEEHQDVLNQVQSLMPAARPDHIFSVTYGNIHQQKFALTASNHTTRLVFHGSRLDNFYSIVNHGLQVSFNKVAAFGPGIYLSSEIGLSLAYSPRGYTWNYSSFGNHISIVSLCEIIDHPDMRCENSPRTQATSVMDWYENPPVPAKYFIVQNDDLVRVRYLLIYSSNDSESACLLESPTWLGWMRRHTMFTLVAAYIILLLAIGSSNSSFVYKIYKKIITTIRSYRDRT